MHTYEPSVPIEYTITASGSPKLQYVSWKLLDILTLTADNMIYKAPGHPVESKY
jgi:hypothetical protein